MRRATFDHNKLNEEDRRFLLNRNLTETASSHQGSLSNVSIFLSLSAVCLSGFSLVYQTKILWLIVVYCVFSLLGLIYFILKFREAQTELILERMRLKINYDELFKHHFAYATKRIE